MEIDLTFLLPLWTIKKQIGTMNARGTKMSNFLPFLSLPFRLSLVKDPPDRDAVLEITYTKPDTTVKTSGWCYQEAQRKSGVAPLSKLHFPQFSFLIPGMTLTSRRMADSSCDLSF